MFSFLIKTPLGSLILIAASLVFYRAGRSLARREAIFLLVPVLIFFIATTQAKINIGIRHILLVYPFLFVLASRLATIRLSRTWLAPTLVGALAPFHRSFFACASRRISLRISTNRSAARSRVTVT